MSTSLPVSRARLLKAMRKVVSATFLLCAMSGICIAQDKTDPSTLPSQPKGQMQNILAAPSKAAESAILGTWGNSRSDKETGEIETTIIVFKPDGTYATRLRNNLFPDWEKLPMAGGRYAVTAANKAGFTLMLERTSGDPEEDKSTARSAMAVSVIDDNTLRAPDGAVLTRIK